MERSSHYYGLFTLCLINGLDFDMAKEIAYASEYVDEAKINTIRFKKEYKDDIFEIEDDICVLNNISTCHSYAKAKTFNYQSMIFNTAAFHFFPGNIGKTFTKKMICRENPKIIDDMINETIKYDKDNTQKLGVLFHILADTYSHQGFSGLISKENDIKDLRVYDRIGLVYKGRKFVNFINTKFLDYILDRLYPSYGHSQALDYPDHPTLKWSYQYDKSYDFVGKYKITIIDNIKRFEKAFDKINNYLESLGYSKNRDYNYKDFLKILKSNTPLKLKTEKWIDLIKKMSNKPKNEILYRDHYWTEKAFKNFNKKVFEQRVINNAELKENYKDSSWFKYILVVKWYKKEFIKRLKKEGLYIPE